MRFGAAFACSGAAFSLLAAGGCSALLNASNLTDGDFGGAGHMAGAQSAGGAGDAGGANGGAQEIGGDGGVGAGPVGGAGGGSGGALGRGGSVGVAGSTGGEPENGGAAGAVPCQPTGTADLCDGLDNDCNSATPDDCPAGCTGQAFEGVGYMVCSYTEKFDAAEAKCVAQGMHLVKIDGPAENTFVLSLVKPIAQSAWIGASDEATSRTFVWLDGKTVVYSNGAPVSKVYENFDTGQPANMPGPNCLLLSRGPTPPAGKWWDILCSTSHPYVCKHY